MTAVPDLSFDMPGLHRRLLELGAEQLDALEFGVIGFDHDDAVRLYNRAESDYAGLGTALMLGQPLFTIVAPCLNNYMVAQRFEDALEEGTVLDEIIDYVLTLRMRPVKVRLRLLAAPGPGMRYVLVQRKP